MRLFSSFRWYRGLHASQTALMVSVMLASFPLLLRAQGKERSVKHPTTYRTAQIDGLTTLVQGFIGSSR
jgi:hypothetical protein